MLGLGLASSHAPAMFEPKEMWPAIYQRRPDYTRDSQPHTAKLETPEVIAGYLERIEAAFRGLRQQLEAYRPDALIVIGDDQGDLFDASLNPTFCLFTGESLWGSMAPAIVHSTHASVSTFRAMRSCPNTCTAAW